MKLHSSKTLIQARKRLQADLVKDHAREALDALSKSLKIKLNTQVTSVNGVYVSGTKIQGRALGFFANALESASIVVHLVEAGDAPGVIIVRVEITYITKDKGRNALSAGVYTYNTETKHLEYLRYS